MVQICVHFLGPEESEGIGPVNLLEGDLRQSDGVDRPAALNGGRMSEAPVVGLEKTEMDRVEPEKIE